ncbi:hypothetical protein EDD18DRAFT_1108598 [Armillaria luteobubalina]|uniref:Uncharacterized protein n=1 Tax=Armillaria luteobubalina TaxID=153913 RepID=A0AA39UU66_9AGAR|nr:hypothetical protein EDD18DRAFT_1108598 [Armillaria luteobubalina]
MSVYTSAALAFNASTVGRIAHRILASICDRVIRTVGTPKKYERTLVLVNELIAEAGDRNDWAIGMGLILPKFGEEGWLGEFSWTAASYACAISIEWTPSL